MITILYRGGPRDGQVIQRAHDPKTITCHAERKALGLPNGHYVTHKMVFADLLGQPVTARIGYVAQWVTLKPGMWRELGIRQAVERLGRLVQNRGLRIAWRGLGE